MASLFASKSLKTSNNISSTKVGHTNSSPNTPKREFQKLQATRQYRNKGAPFLQIKQMSYLINFLLDVNTIFFSVFGILNNEVYKERKWFINSMTLSKNKQTETWKSLRFKCMNYIFTFHGCIYLLDAKYANSCNLIYVTMVSAFPDRACFRFRVIDNCWMA